jgi:hypothetical protein
MASRAIPSHLKPSSAAGKDDGGFNSQRHHGKSQSHVVSQPFVSASLHVVMARHHHISVFGLSVGNFGVPPVFRSLEGGSSVYSENLPHSLCQHLSSRICMQTLVASFCLQLSCALCSRQRSCITSRMQLPWLVGNSAEARIHLSSILLHESQQTLERSTKKHNC